MSDAKDRRIMLLRYGELVARKACGKATEEEIKEMEDVRKELNLSVDEIVAEVEKLVKNNY